MTTRKWRLGALTFAAASLIPLSTSFAGAGTYAADIPPATHVADAPAACATRVPSDFNGDGFADLATGEPNRAVDLTPGDDGTVQTAAGAVQVDYGSATGIDPSKTQYFDQNSPNIKGAPTTDDNFAAALATGYFNDDCYADLAIGTPGEGNGDMTVLYGGPAGLSTSGAAQFTGRSANSFFGTALASGDFNHDGFDDVVAGAPGATDAGQAGSGEVGVMLGGATGLQAPSPWLNQSSSGMPGVAEHDDQFGATLAAADFTGDGFTDLAIGTPLEDNGSVADGGSVAILKGSVTGVVATGAQLWTQSSTNVPGTDEAGDEFGLTLCAGDVNGDGKADLLIGTPLEDIGSVADAGSVTYLPGTTAGVTGTGSTSFTQSTSGIPGSVDDLDYFGLTVAVADFNGDGKADVAIGTPQDLTGTVFGGSVTVLSGTAGGPVAAGSKFFDQNTSGVPGTAEDFDWFGSTLHPAYLHSRTQADLVVAAQFEDGGAFTDNGTVSVLPGVATTGLTGTGSYTVSENALGGGPQDDGAFGTTLG